MSYSVVLAPRTAEKIRRFLPDVRADVLRELRRRGENPRLAVRIREGPQTGRSVYTFRVSRPPLTWRFTVLFRFSVDEKDIEITDFGVLKGEPPELFDP